VRDTVPKVIHAVPCRGGAQREVVSAAFDQCVRAVSKSGWHDERQKNESTDWYSRYLDGH
jgi:hypothetical protein